MYDEIVKVLRRCVLSKPCDGCPYYDPNGPTEKCATLNLAAADAIEALEIKAEVFKSAYIAEHNARIDEIKRNMWIPVTERLPEEDEPVFVVRKFLGIKGQVPPSTYTEIAYRVGDNWYADSDEYKIARNRHTDPLFWMPLPEPPESEEQHG